MTSVAARLAPAALCVLLPAAVAVAAPGPGDVGSQAADFTLQDLQGNVHTLSEHRGKVVMLFIVGYG